jgi:hypothetical protein
MYVLFIYQFWTSAFLVLLFGKLSTNVECYDDHNDRRFFEVIQNCDKPRFEYIRVNLVMVIHWVTLLRKTNFKFAYPACTPKGSLTLPIGIWTLIESEWFWLTRTGGCKVLRTMRPHGAEKCCWMLVLFFMKYLK